MSIDRAGMETNKPDAASDTSKCWPWRGAYCGKEVVMLYRNSCPRCGYHRVSGLCLVHLAYFERKIQGNGSMHCSDCQWTGKCSDFWTLMGAP